MDLNFTVDDLAFQREVRDFLAQNLTSDLKQATSLTTTVFVEKDIALKWQAKLNAKGWLAYLADPIWRPGLDFDPALHLPDRVRAGRRPRHYSHGHPLCGASDLYVRDSEAEGFFPAEDSQWRTLLVPGLFRTRRRVGSGIAQVQGRACG